MLDHRVVDAEYSPKSDLLVTVSANPSRLTIIDVQTGRTTPVNLSLPPTSVSIDPLGLTAAVGHDASVTLVDLTSGTVKRVFPVTADVLDVVLGTNWAYVFPRRDQWTSIFSINLASGQQVDST